MRTYKDLVKIYILKSMILRMRKLFCKTSMVILTISLNLSWNLLRVKRIWTNWSQCIFFNKEGLGFNPNNKKRSSKHFFINETSHTTTTISPNVGPAFAGSGEIQLLATLPLLAFLPIERPIPRDPRKEFCENIL